MLDELKQKAGEFLNSDKVQSAINTAKEKAEELKNNEKVQAAMSKAKDKAEDYICEKTDGKGILGFGKSPSSPGK